MYSTSLIFCLESTFYLLWIIIQSRGWCARKHTLCMLCSIEQCQKYKKTSGKKSLLNVVWPILFYSDDLAPFEQVGVALPVHGNLRLPKRSKPAPSPVHWHMIVWSDNLHSGLQMSLTEEVDHFVCVVDEANMSVFFHLLFPIAKIYSCCEPLSSGVLCAWFWRVFEMNICNNRRVVRDWSQRSRSKKS